MTPEERLAVLNAVIGYRRRAGSGAEDEAVWRLLPRAHSEQRAAEFGDLPAAAANALLRAGFLTRAAVRQASDTALLTAGFPDRRGGRRPGQIGPKRLAEIRAVLPYDRPQDPDLCPNCAAAPGRFSGD